jgi:hypothetical protein
MEFILKANSIDGSYFEGGARNFEGIKCVPSALMRTTSYDFSRETNFTQPLGVFELDITNSLGVLEINKLVGFFQSTNGKHFVELHIPLNFDLSALGNNSYILAFYPKYYKADVILEEFPYTELIFEVVTSTESYSGIKLADLEINAGDITSITPIQTDNYAQKFREKIGADNFVSKSGDTIQGNLSIAGSLEVNDNVSFKEFAQFDKAVELGTNTDTGNPRIQFADVATNGVSFFLDMNDRFLKVDKNGNVYNVWTSENFNPDSKSDTGHTHNISDVNNLQLELDNKSNKSHTHTFSSITDKPSTYPPSAHTHSISNIDNLQNSLDSKPTGSWSFDGNTLKITM